MKHIFRYTVSLILGLLLSYGVWRLDQHVGGSYIIVFLGGACSMGIMLAVLFTVTDRIESKQTAE